VTRREDEVVQEALRQTEARRRRRRGQEALRWVIAWWVLVLLVYFLIPWPYQVNRVWAAVHGLCAQVEGHMPCFDGRPLSLETPACGRPLPLCTRDSGLYVGALLGMVYLLARRRWRAAGRPPRWFWAILAAIVALFVVDVLNSVALDWFNTKLLYPPNNILRLTSGLLMGLVVSVPLLWAINLSFAGRQRERPILAHWADPLGLLLVGAAGGAALWSGWPPLHIPLLVLSVGGAVAMLAAGNTLAILTINRGKELLADTWEIFTPLLWGSIAAVGEMALLALLRYRIGG